MPLQATSNKACGEMSRSTVHIRPYRASDREALVHLALRAWEPVFDSIRQAMDPEVYRVFYPDGWRKSQAESVRTSLAEHDVWVAERDSGAIGFVSVMLHRENSTGEIYMVAVDPDHQREGVGTALSTYALDWMRQAGMAVAMVETGGDPGHAAARRTYEKVGFSMLPITRYFKKL